MHEFIPYGRQNIDEEDIKAVIEALRCDWITQGPRVEEFEARVAEYCGVRYAVAFNSGTSALHAAMYAAGIGVGD
ncbi:MAG TPA: UDP-4-amino-4,6-dideoxy-N-acetyl-beta-L-altrosamine transaminase, partial [Gelria sp.]|nr:UDP-4-amino-4,6-dideoxy-N-acetyl-beta-L-altrosamine transaminase [Gelria sp.]